MADSTVFRDDRSVSQQNSDLHDHSIDPVWLADGVASPVSEITARS